jgi:ribosomal protein S17E
MLEEFRELVRAGILRVTPENEVLPVKPTSSGAASDTPESREEDVALLDKQLMEWMERRRAQKAAEARRRGSAKVADREPEPEALSASIRQKVIERVAQKILETWDTTVDQASDQRQSLRDQVVERVAEEILRRWQGSLE